MKLINVNVVLAKRQLIKNSYVKIAKYFMLIDLDISEMSQAINSTKRNIE